MTKQVTPSDLSAMKKRGDRIPALTAYDYTSAQIVEAAGLPLMLVGDTLGMVVLGHDTTIPVTLEAMIHHARAVVRGAERALVVVDMPFLTYQIRPDQALENAGRIFQETGCRAIKLEGGEEVAPAIARLVSCGMPVLGHLGYAPQSAHRFGRAAVQGRSEQTATNLIRDALALQETGAFGIVLELVPAALAREISRRLRIPTIGIGSGPHCDGQIQVFHDVFGLYTNFQPRHAKRYLELATEIKSAAELYAEEVRGGAFPSPMQTADMDATVLQRVVSRLPELH